MTLRAVARVSRPILSDIGFDDLGDAGFPAERRQQILNSARQKGLRLNRQYRINDGTRPTVLFPVFVNHRACYRQL